MYQIIKCPNCGYEYSPAEIFIPYNLVGKPEYVLRDEEGKITKILGLPIDLEEEFTCDKCNTTFVVTANINYDVRIDPQLDFAHEYETRLTK